MTPFFPFFNSLEYGGIEMNKVNKNCGIYQIRNILTRVCYAGQSIDIKDRERHHWNSLKNNKHDNSHLQNSYNKHGRNKFVFEVLLYCEPEELTYYEQFFVDKYVSLKLTYNICRKCVDSTKGFCHSKETREKLSKAAKNRLPMTEETKNRISEATRGKNHHAWGKKGKDSPLWGKTRSEETKEKIGIANKGHIVTDETKEKLRKSRVGFKHTPETKIKMSRSHMGTIISDKTRQKLSDTNVGKKKGNNTSSKHVGICYRKDSKKWSARIRINRKRVFLGLFTTEKKAIGAYKNKLREIGGFHNDS